MNEPKKLYRDTENKKIAGICAGIAQYFNVDVTLVRLIVVILAFASAGSEILLYLLFILIIPAKPKDTTTLGKE